MRAGQISQNERERASLSLFVVSPHWNFEMAFRSQVEYRIAAIVVAFARVALIEVNICTRRSAVSQRKGTKEGGSDDDLGIAGPSAFKRPSINDFRNDGEGKELSKSKQY